MAMTNEEAHLILQMMGIIIYVNNVRTNNVEMFLRSHYSCKRITSNHISYQELLDNVEDNLRIEIRALEG